jgi:hypothetical protein
MKSPLTAFAISLLAICTVNAAPPATIRLRDAHRHVLPGQKNGDASSLIEVTAEITNTSNATIHFEDFSKYICRRTNSNHWSSVRERRMTGMCWGLSSMSCLGGGFTVRSLAPGESFKETMLLDSENAGHRFRVTLRVTKASKSSQAGTRIESDPMVLPR